MQWYAVHTKPSQEYQATLNLESLGVETFYPKIKHRKTIRRKRQTFIGPLFPGYLFARFDAEKQYRAVIFARGVRKVVMFGSVPAVVDEEILNSIRARLEDNCLTVSPPSFAKGQIVRIQNGPLHGLEAVFEREMGDHERAVLLLQMLECQARVIVHLQHVVDGQIKPTHSRRCIPRLSSTGLTQQY